MTQSGIPENLRHFLLGHFDSIAQWECLLLLRSPHETAWGVTEVARRLYIDSSSASAILHALERRGLIKATRQEEESRFSYAPATEVAASSVDQLAELYRTYLIAITEIIHSKQKSQIQAFADSFKFRKD